MGCRSVATIADLKSIAVRLIHLRLSRSSKVYNDTRADPRSLPDSTRHFVRVTIVHPDISIPETFTPVKTPTGADASAGEVIQTPERLRGLDGRSGQLCVFAKLSVRMPGVFRLKFTLYETLE